MEQKDKIEVKMVVDNAMFKDLERLTALCRSPNITTAVCEAVNNMLTLYDFQIRGYKVEIKVSRGNDIKLVKLPSIL